ncbi:MAG: putative amidohydrolase YtcJ [Bacteroidia bacterium]|jgi:predicted amidohydrolase YtcJ
MPLPFFAWCKCKTKKAQLKKSILTAGIHLQDITFDFGVMKITNEILQSSLILTLLLIFPGCNHADKQNVDTILFNGVVYTCDSAFTMAEAVAIQNGLIVATGSDMDIFDKFTSQHNIDLKKKPVYPGFIDAHSHFYGYGNDLQELDLKSCISFEDMINKTVAYAQASQPNFIIGRGWNEENWVVKGTINKTRLDILFPDIPVFLQRVDGHAALCNQAALDLANIDVNTFIAGGRIEKMGPFLTGIITDKAAGQVMDILPEPSLEQRKKALVDAQNACYKAGLTTVTDAGLELDIIVLMDSLLRSKDLSIQLYVMADPDTNSINTLLNNKVLMNNKKLGFHSVKLYADGSLGSRGALLKIPYCDDETQIGLIQHPIGFYKSLIAYCYKNNLQVNTHCIGDSANNLLLNLYGTHLKGKNDLRWRIEHAQVVDPIDFSLFSKFSIIPSIQPTHATSDASMAKKRLCDHPTMSGAYAYKSLLDETGLVAFGTDFPVESIDPIATFFSAVKRRTKTGEIFKPEEAIAPKDALLAMTIWAAYSCKLEDRIGSIEIGKIGNITILSDDMMTAYNRGRISTILTMSDGNIVHNSGVLAVSSEPN